MTKPSVPANNLAIINTKILADGEHLPDVKLKDGTTVQTGTVATLLHNINLYNNHLTDNEQKIAIEAELLAAIPTLIKVGLFELFSPDEWIQGSPIRQNAGRKLVGEYAKKFLDSEKEQKHEV